MSNNAIQVWSPDTCDCVIHLAYDDRLPAEQRTLVYATEEEAEAIVKTRFDVRSENFNPLITNKKKQPPAVICPAHASLGKKPQLLSAVLDENTRKNKAFRIVTEVVPSFDIKDFKWSFDLDRILEVELVGLSGISKSQIKNKFNQELGDGKVKVK